LLAPYLLDVAYRSDWQSALIVGLAPIGFLAGVAAVDRRRRWAAWGVAAVVAYLYLAFWVNTHRLDRFWLPMQPFLCVLAGVGAAWTGGAAWRSVVAMTLAGGVAYNLLFCTTPLCGLHTFTADLKQRARDNVRLIWPALAVVDQGRQKDEQPGRPHHKNAPAGATVLYVGFAAVYDAEHSAKYNTVWDENLFLRCTTEPYPRPLDEVGRAKPANAARRALAEAGVDYVAVDWTWVERYREPGNYGFPAGATRGLFRELARAGVLQRVTAAPGKTAGEPALELYRVVAQPVVEPAVGGAP
ncbi:MAG: hypothetical protein ACRDD1_04020, partial [Planctomycetia bacterium]